MTIKRNALAVPQPARKTKPGATAGLCFVFDRRVFLVAAILFGRIASAQKLPANEGIRILADNLAIDDHGAGGGRGKGVRRFSPRSVAIVTLRRGKRRRSSENRERGSDEKFLHDGVSKIVARPWPTT
jgi:hypothetical protein